MTVTELLAIKHDYDPAPDAPTVVESLEEAAFILEESPDTVILIRPTRH